MRFAPEGSNRTRLDLTLRYRPVYTSLREALRALVAPPRAPAMRAAMANASTQLNRLGPGSPAAPPAGGAGGATDAAPPA